MHGQSIGLHRGQPGGEHLKACAGVALHAFDVLRERARFAQHLGRRDLFRFRGPRADMTADVRHCLDHIGRAERPADPKTRRRERF